MTNATRDAHAAGLIPDRPPPGMDPVDWDVLQRRLAGVPLRAIADAYLVTRERIRQREGRGLRVCRVHAARIRAEASRAADRLRLAPETATLFLGYAVDLIAQGRAHPPPPVSGVRYHPGWLVAAVPDPPPLPEPPPAPIAPSPPLDPPWPPRWFVRYLLSRVDVGIPYSANPVAWETVAEWAAGPDLTDSAAVNRRIAQLVATRDQLRRAL